MDKTLQLSQRNGSSVFRFRSQKVSTVQDDIYRTYDALRIVRVHRGGCRWQIEDVLYTVRAGDILIFNNTERRVHTELLVGDPFEQQVIEFLPSFAYPLISCLHVFFRRPAGFCHVLDRQSPYHGDISRCFSLIAQMWMNDSAWRDTVIQGAFLQLLSILPCAFGCEVPQDDTISERNFARICDSVAYIDENYSGNLTVAQLAARTGLSRFHYTRLFSDIWGLSPVEYIRIRRVKAALALIRGKNTNILDAALRCGFTSSSGFYKAVHDITGLSPKDASETFFQADSVRSEISPNTSNNG